MRSSALGWIVAVNNFYGLFKSAWSTTWVQFTKSAKIYSDYRHVFCYKKKVGSLQLTVNNVCDKNRRAAKCAVVKTS